MKCDNAMRRYLELDNRAYMPLIVKFHTLTCPHCRIEISRLERELADLRRDTPFIMKRDLGDSVMSCVRRTQIEHSPSIGTGMWIAVGAAILSSIVLAPFSDSLIWLKGYFGRDLELPFSIILGVTISGYAALYIGTHMEQLKNLQTVIIKKLGI